MATLSKSIKETEIDYSHKPVDRKTDGGQISSFYWKVECGAFHYLEKMNQPENSERIQFRLAIAARSPTFNFTTYLSTER